MVDGVDSSDLDSLWLWVGEGFGWLCESSVKACLWVRLGDLCGFLDPPDPALSCTDSYCALGNGLQECTRWRKASETEAAERTNASAPPRLGSPVALKTHRLGRCSKGRRQWWSSSGCRRQCIAGMIQHRSVRRRSIWSRYRI